MPEITLNPNDAVELAEMLEFIAGGCPATHGRPWLTASPRS
jgi:hypothetical protein